MSNKGKGKVWVTWKSTGEDLFAKVTELDDDADVADLCRSFVNQQNLTTTVPGGLKVSKADGPVLSEDYNVRPFFVSPGTQASTPGKSKAMALVVTLPQQQGAGQQQQISQGVITTPPISPPSYERFAKLFDQLRLDLQVPNQRATPALTPAHLGEEELNTLRNSNRVSTFGGGKGQPACLNITEFELLASQSSESEIVACLTPIFDHIFEDLVVVNAEEYTWLEVSTNTIRYNQKPDMLVCHGAIYQKREASKTSDATESLRTPYFKFGVLSNWVLRDCISVILEAKTKIDNHSFGEVINYGRHVSLHHPEPNDVRIVLFDKTEFWLVTFASGVCAMVTKCQWMVEGSRKLLKDFAKASKWIEVLDSVCEELDLVVAEGRAFLGYGSFGRVFRVFRRNGGRSARDELALKIVLGVDSLELRTEAGYLRQAFSRTPDHVVEVTEFKEVQKGAGLLLACVGRPILKSEFSSVIEALATLHANHIYHGDPRLANAVVAGRTVKWIDFRGACFHPVTTPKHFLHDMNILVCSVMSVSSLSLLP